MECPRDDVHLLLTREPHEVDGVARHANRQARVLLRMLHRVDERVAIEDVDVHVKTRGREVSVEDVREVRDLVLDAAAAWMPWLSRPCIGFAPGANGSPFRRPSGVFPVAFPYTTFDVIVRIDWVWMAFRYVGCFRSWVMKVLTSQ